MSADVLSTAGVAGVTAVDLGRRSVAALAGAAAGLPPVDLDTVVATAALSTRIDHKYVVPVSTVVELLGELTGRAMALRIGDLRTFDYLSVYFDTPGLDCFRDHRQGRRHRAKVRTRSYLDSGSSFLEVKRTARRGATEKLRTAYPVADAARLSDVGARFVAAHLPDRLSPLSPVLSTRYRRSTFLVPDTGTRITCDADLRFADGTREVSVGADVVILEAKSAHGDDGLGTALRRHGLRPVPISKYCAGVAVLRPDLAANPWYRLLRRLAVAPR